MAGFMLRGVNNFKLGDFLRVGEQFGRVTERGFFHTEIQTENRDLTTLPNIYLVSQPVTVVRSSGTVISAEVSLGYDVPVESTKRLLAQAAVDVELADVVLLLLSSLSSDKDFCDFFSTCNNCASRSVCFA